MVAWEPILKSIQTSPSQRGNQKNEGGKGGERRNFALSWGHPKTDGQGKGKGWERNLQTRRGRDLLNAGRYSGQKREGVLGAVRRRGEKRKR